jgi:hypothetical protein
LHLRGQKIEAPGSRTANPFYELFRKVDRPTGAVWESVYRSNTIKNNINPLWNEVNLNLEAACNGDLDRAIKIVLWDHKRSGKHKYMGECETTVGGLVDAGDSGHEEFLDGNTGGGGGGRGAKAKVLQVVEANLSPTFFDSEYHRQQPLVVAPTGAYKVLRGVGPSGTDVVRFFIETKQEITSGRKSDVNCPKGRIYGTCGYFPI